MTASIWPCLRTSLECPFNEPLTTIDTYVNIDADVPATEDLDEGSEDQLVEDFLAEMAEQDREGEVYLGSNPAITNFSSALSSAAELRLFATKKGLTQVLFNLMSIEAKLQEALVRVNMNSNQSCTDASILTLCSVRERSQCYAYCTSIQYCNFSEKYEYCTCTCACNLHSEPSLPRKFINKTTSEVVVILGFYCI